MRTWLIRGAALAAATAVVLLVFYYVWLAPSLFATDPALSAAEQHKAVADARTGITQAFTALGVVGTLIYTMRTFRTNQLSQLTGRFESASKQIGDDNAVVRIAGLHAMAQVADLWPAERQSCINVLCAHVRQPTDSSSSTPVDSTATSGGSPAPPEVALDSRRAGLDIIAQHLRPDGRVSWAGHHIDLSGAVVDAAEWEGIVLKSGQVKFRGARFTGSANLAGAVLCGGVIDLTKAVFEKDCSLSFKGADFRTGKILFQEAHLTNGKVVFDDATFHPQCLASFASTHFGDCTVSFANATVLQNPAFSAHAEDDRGLSFAGATFCPTSSYQSIFNGMKFHGPVSFARAIFQRSVSFDASEVTSVLDFRGAQLDAIVSFREADVAEGTIDLRGTVPGRGKIDVSWVKNEALPVFTGVETEEIRKKLVRLPPTIGAYVSTAGTKD